MTTENRDDRDFDDSITSEGGAVRKADGAIRDTAQKYLDRSGIKLDLQQIEKTIREKPLRSAAIAAGAGFVVGGGTVTRQRLGDARTVWPPGRSRNGDQLHQQRSAAELPTTCTAQKSLSQ